MSSRAFILTSQWSDKNRYPLQYYCSSDDGPVLLKFDAEQFVFFADRSKMNQSFVTPFSQKTVPLKSFDQLDVQAIYCKNSNDFFNLKKEMADKGIRTFENDIWPTDRFLMERFINGSIEIAGESIYEDGVHIYLNPKIKPAHYDPNFLICSLDIETGVDGSLYSIGVHFSGTKSHKFVYMLADESKKINNELEFFSNEKKLLKKFIFDIRELDPDILIGWHVIGFDLKFLENKCLKLGVPFIIGRDHTEVRVEEKKGSGFFAKINGRVVIDGPPAFRSAFYQFKNFKLETVASELLGTSKDIASDAGKVSEIERRFKEDKISLAKYNLLDCTLVTDLYHKVSMIKFLTQRVKVSGLLMDRLGISTAALDHVLLPKLHRKGMVAPNSSSMDRDEHSTGGMVIEPKVGLHENVAVFDFKSLYPSIIRTFKIDPYSRVMSHQEEISNPTGVKFSRTYHLLPEIIEQLLILRQRAKDNNDRSLNLAIKILMNSFYGLMGSFRCRFYHADLPKAITQTGHWLLNQTIGFFENRNMEVLYGDTDSIFVKLTDDSGSSSIKIAETLAEEVNEFLARVIRDDFGLESHLELEFEKNFSKIYFSSIRGTDSGAKKKYVGLSQGEMIFTGMEYVRSDWTDLAKKFQYGLFEIFFMGGAIEGYIKDYIQNLKNGLYDEDLSITKKLSKDPKEYTKNIPPHVKAALLVNHTGPYRLKEVTYIMTVKGPVPIQNEPSSIDYEFYIEKQIKPLADQVLNSMGKSFESVALGDQLTLF